MTDLQRRPFGFKCTHASGNLSEGIFERPTSTGNGRFALIESGFAKVSSRSFFTKLKILSDTNLVALMYNKKEKASLPVDVGSLSNRVLGRQTFTGSGLFASLGSGLVQTLG